MNKKSKPTLKRNIHDEKYWSKEQHLKFIKEKSPDINKTVSDMSDRQVKKYLTERVWKHFCKWMTGQTRPVLPDGKGGFFKYDVERYADWLIEGKPTFWD